MSVYGEYAGGAKTTGGKGKRVMPGSAKKFAAARQPKAAAASSPGGTRQEPERNCDDPESAVDEVLRRVRTLCLARGIDGPRLAADLEQHLLRVLGEETGGRPTSLTFDDVEESEAPVADRLDTAAGDAMESDSEQDAVTEDVDIEDDAAADGGAVPIPLEAERQLLDFVLGKKADAGGPFRWRGAEEPLPSTVGFTVSALEGKECFLMIRACDLGGQRKVCDALLAIARKPGLGVPGTVPRVCAEWGAVRVMDQTVLELNDTVALLLVLMLPFLPWGSLCGYVRHICSQCSAPPPPVGNPNFSVARCAECEKVAPLCTPTLGSLRRCFCEDHVFMNNVMAPGFGDVTAMKYIFTKVAYYGQPPTMFGDCSGRQKRLVVYRMIYDLIGYPPESDGGRPRVELMLCVVSRVRGRFPDTKLDFQVCEMLEAKKGRGEKLNTAEEAVLAADHRF